MEPMRSSKHATPMSLVAALAFLAMAVAVPPVLADDAHVEVVAPNVAPIDDHALENAIEDRLRRATTVDDSDIDVFSSDGVVKLSGSVGSFAEKNRALEIAKSFRGVRGVADELHVLKSDRQDATIQDDVAWTLSNDPYLRGSDIQVAVHNGEVSLSGKVDSWAKKNMASKLAQGIAGVTDIDNKIDLSFTASSSDSDIQQAIARHFRETRSLSDDEITIHVNQGQVELHGTVDSIAEEDYARQLAWVHGVTNVDSDLAVSREPQPVRTQVALSDAELKAILEHRLMEQPFLGIDDIKVGVTSGVVTLEGVVPSIRTKEAAVREAQLTNGVVRIHDRLKVHGAPLNASELHDALHRDLSVAAALADDEISVNVEETGAVYLSGQVDSMYERNEAVRIASRYPGVTEIVNNLDVQQSQTPLSDAELAQAIRDELYWSALVDADDITVNVENGVVTLTGTVEDLSEFEAAIDNTYQAGARDVIAKLRLDDGGMIEDDIRVQAKYSYKKE